VGLGLGLKSPARLAGYDDKKESGMNSPNISQEKHPFSSFEKNVLNFR